MQLAIRSLVDRTVAVSVAAWYELANHKQLVLIFYKRSSSSLVPKARTDISRNVLEVVVRFS